MAKPSPVHQPDSLIAKSDRGIILHKFENIPRFNMALCIESWRKVQAIDNYKDVAGELLFRR
jgi:hypothetical protein